MLFHAKLEIDGKYVGIDCEPLAISTQGKNVKDALNMLIDAVDSLSEGKVKIEVFKQAGDYAFFKCNDSASLLSFSLKRIREEEGLSLGDVADILGLSSRNTLHRYEKYYQDPSKGSKISVDKFMEIVAGIKSAHEDSIEEEKPELVLMAV